MINEVYYKQQLISNEIFKELVVVVVVVLVFVRWEGRRREGGGREEGGGRREGGWDYSIIQKKREGEGRWDCS